MDEHSGRALPALRAAGDLGGAGEGCVDADFEPRVPAGLPGTLSVVLNDKTTLWPEARLSGLCLGFVEACPPSFRNSGPGGKSNVGWGRRDRE